MKNPSAGGGIFIGKKEAVDGSQGRFLVHHRPRQPRTVPTTKRESQTAVMILSSSC